MVEKITYSQFMKVLQCEIKKLSQEAGIDENDLIQGIKRYPLKNLFSVLSFDEFGKLFKKIIEAEMNAFLDGEKHTMMTINNSLEKMDLCKDCTNKIKVYLASQTKSGVERE